MGSVLFEFEKTVAAVIYKSYKPTQLSKELQLNDSTMIVGVPKEIKNSENRVALTPAGTSEFVKHGHQVYVQATAGIGSGFADDDYLKAGAKILPTIEEIYGIADMILKVNFCIIL